MTKRSYRICTCMLRQAPTSLLCKQLTQTFGSKRPPMVLTLSFAQKFDICGSNCVYNCYPIFIPSLVCNLDPVPFDCQEAYVLGCRRSGVYTIDPGCGKSFSVWCDMNNGGGWTVFQRRRDGSVDFYRGWAEYEDGFGNVKGEHWLGLKKINCLTGARPVAQLRVDLGDFEGHYKYAQYRYFSVGDSTTNYTLRVGGYMAGPPAAAGDSLSYHKDMQFSTHDRDNDMYSGNCAVT